MQRRWIGLCATVVAVACAAVDVDDAFADRRPRPGATIEVTGLGWPASTQSAEAIGAVKVYRQRGKRRRGRLAAGTRTGWVRIVASRDRCRGWLELAVGGWVCARDLRPSELPPVTATDTAQITAAALARAHAGVVAAGARAYPTLAAALRGGRSGKPLAGWTFLHGAIVPITAGGRRFVKTRRGVIAADRVEPRHASSFVGLDLIATPPASWPFAYVVARRKVDPVVVRAQPDATAQAIDTIGARAVVAVLEERAGFVRIGVDRWVARDELRVVRTAPRPHGIAADERWLDVDLDEQVLVAYVGDQPVYATLVSGGRGKSTPTGIHRVREKRAVARLKSPAIARGRWDVGDVPFALTFRKYYAVHGAYWHDSFGKPRSQGCVNVAPRDAQFLFDWTMPALPPGWTSVHAQSERDGTPIRLRNRKDPDPVWTDFDAPPPVRTRDVAPSDDASVDSAP